MMAPRLGELAVIACLIPLATAVALANPAPPYEETVTYAEAYDQTVADLGEYGGWYRYRWDITYNGVEALPDPEFMRAFVVYDPDGSIQLRNASAWWTGTSDPLLDWHGVEDGANVAAEWYAAPASGARLYPGAEVSFQGDLGHALASTSITAIHIQYGEDSEWVNNVPEVGTWALLLATGAFGGWLKRRRKEH